MWRVPTQYSCVAPRRSIALDDLDHRLLECLQQDARRTLQDLGDA
jgi:DNA-binding Lrp family transcriptional regulator